MCECALVLDLILIHHWLEAALAESSTEHRNSELPHLIREQETGDTGAR